MSEIEIEGSVCFSILLASCVMWSGALDSSSVLQSHSITSPTQHNNIILIFDIYPILNI